MTPLTSETITAPAEKQNVSGDWSYKAHSHILRGHLRRTVNVRSRLICTIDGVATDRSRALTQNINLSQRTVGATSTRKSNLYITDALAGVLFTSIKLGLRPVDSMSSPYSCIPVNSAPRSPPQITYTAAKRLHRNAW